MRRRAGGACAAGIGAHAPRSHRNLPEREPARQLGLDRQLVRELPLELKLALVVALLVSRRYERVPRPALEVVDEVDRAAVLLELEHRAQEPVAVAAALELAGDEVDRRDEVLELVAAQDDPPEAVLVVCDVDLGAGVLRRAAKQVLGVGDDLAEVAGRERLE